MLAGHDDIYVVTTAQTMVDHRQQAVSVRRQVDPDDLRLLVHHMIEETGILVRKAIVVLAPDMGAQQIVQGGDSLAPRQAARDLQPLRMLVEHRINDVNERLVTVEQPVPAGEQIALKPALALMFAQHFQYAAGGCQKLIPRQRARLPLPVCRLEYRLQPVG